ncbi:MAG: ATPase [Firmicutes bacterium]|jgi:hypothetical protein|nr:ATPase [Bacillota bacterium]MBQ1715008.1 ATPase [Bacillota bacterium]MBQ1826030.1 ATPase [Bacillota bacterium]
MEDTTKVLDLLDELEDLLEGATSVPLTNKIVLESEDLFGIIKDIRLALPDDMQQAKWIIDERDRILREGKDEYGKMIREAKKQAEYLVDSDEITRRATKKAESIIEDANIQAKFLKMKTYDYVDRMLYGMQQKMDELNMKYFGEMYTNLEHTFTAINDTLTENREEIKSLAYKTQNEEDEQETR